MNYFNIIQRLADHFGVAETVNIKPQQKICSCISTIQGAFRVGKDGSKMALRVKITVLVAGTYLISVLTSGAPLHI